MPLLSKALDHLLRATGDPLYDLKEIGPDHPSHARAEVLRAAVGVLAKVPAALPSVAHAIAAADSPRLSPRLRRHLEAAEAWVRGEAEQAAQHYENILARWPRDLLALRLAQSCYFFLGQPQQMCASVDAVLPEWKRDSAAFDFVLAMSAFAHAESGHADRAEQLGRAALARNPACPLGVHAVAHAIAESGRPDAGARWMRRQRAQWAVQSRMLTHNAWHLAMFDVDEGRVTPALRILDTCILPAAAQSPVDACDAVSLLWRVVAEEPSVSDRWQQLSDAFERLWQPGFWPYVDLHAALAHLRAGRRERFERFLDGAALSALGTHTVATRARDITLPILRALGAGNDEVRTRTATAIAQLGPLLGDAGGSRLQLGVFAPPSVATLRPVRTAPAAAAAVDVSWRRQVAGGAPNSRLNARLKAASDS
jgi:hypothetical protein